MFNFLKKFAMIKLIVLISVSGKSAKLHFGDFPVIRKCLYFNLGKFPIYQMYVALA